MVSDHTPAEHRLSSVHVTQAKCKSATVNF